MRQQSYEAMYSDPELVIGLCALDKMRERRVDIALAAANYIVDECGGETQDIRLYYAAMYGRAYDDGIYEHDQNLLVPLDITRKLRYKDEPGEPFQIRAVNYPDMNVTVGEIASFSGDAFVPSKFEVTMEREDGDFCAWRGHLAIAMCKVVPDPEGREAGTSDFMLDDEVTKQIACETATWASRTSGGLEIHSAGTGGVEVGVDTFLNSADGIHYHDKMGAWLRAKHAPTTRLVLPADRLKREVDRSLKWYRDAAKDQGVSEGVAAARALSPTTVAFFEKLEPYTTEGQPINIVELFKSWRDPYDAQELLAGLECHGFVAPDRDGNLIMTKLGLEAFENRHEAY